MKKHIAVLATTVVAMGIGIASMGPASAGLTTSCVGEGGAVTVPGDLVVPKGKSCTLTGTTVTGNVRLAAGADLIAQDVTINGSVTAAAGAYFDANATTVDGRVVLKGAYGAYLESSTVQGNLVNSAVADPDSGGFLYILSSNASANVVARAGELFVENSEVGGSITTEGAVFTDLYDTFVDGRLSISGNTDGSVVCGSVIQKKATFLDNGTSVQLGADGPSSPCPSGSSYWGQDVLMEGTTGGVHVDRNLVNGNLTLQDNDPVARVGSGNRVRGEVIGEFEAWDGNDAMKQSRRTAVPTERSDDLLGLIAERAQQAVDEASAAGDANL